jgi:ferredoxin
MGTRIYYYTGTGNSLWVARMIARELGDVELTSIADWEEGREAAHSSAIGLVFPVYIWGLPRRIVRFADGLKRLRPEYVFAVAVNGGQVSRTLVQLRNLLKKSGITLSSGFSVTMPSNYIPWGGPGSPEERQKLYESALPKISAIASSVRNREARHVEKGPLWQRVIFSLIYKLSFPKVPHMDKQFWVDDKCTRCGICSKVCPAHNVAAPEGTPSWNHGCEQCFACLQWCPREAIQYGKKPPQYERYHHPEVRLQDVLKSGGLKGRGA